jgi:hypothetical protein
MHCMWNAYNNYNNIIEVMHMMDNIMQRTANFHIMLTFHIHNIIFTKFYRPKLESYVTNEGVKIRPNSPSQSD